MSVWNVDWLGGARCGSGGRMRIFFLGIGGVMSGDIVGVVVGGWWMGCILSSSCCIEIVWVGCFGAGIVFRQGLLS